MLLRLQAYDPNIIYKKGTELYVPDTLSRASLSTTSGPAASKTTHVFSLEIESISLTDNIDVQDEQLEKIKTTHKQ